MPASPTRSPDAADEAAGIRVARPGAKELVLLALVLAAGFSVRWPFRHAPLIRDEAEYAQLGQAILTGAVPYLDIYNQKPPVTHYLMAALQSVAGTDLDHLRVATTLYGLATTLVLYLLARGLFGWRAALLTALAFSVVTFASTAIVHSASTEYYMLFFSAAGVLLWARGTIPAAFGAGVCAGLAFQTKQTGAVLLVFLLADAILQRLRARQNRAVEAAAVLAGFTLVCASILLFFTAQGALDAYLECTWLHNLSYVGARHGGVAQTLALSQAVLTQVAGPGLGLWVLGTIGLGLMARDSDSPGSNLWLLLAGSLAAAFLAGAPFAHYYHPISIPVALGVGFVMASSWETLRRGRRAAALALAVVCWTPALVDGFDKLRAPSRSLEEAFGHLFPAVESPEIARYLAEHTRPGESFAVIGSQPELFYYAERPSASRMPFSYPMSGPYAYAAALRAQFLEVLAAETRPRYAVYVGYPPSLATNSRDAERFARRVLPTLLAHYEAVRRFPNADSTLHVEIYRRKAPE